VRGDSLSDSGAIEGNGDKLAANRMKKRGMSWTMLEPGFKLLCPLYMDHTRIVAGFRFSGHYPMEFWRFNLMTIQDSHRPIVDSCSVLEGVDANVDRWYSSL